MDSFYRLTEDDAQRIARVGPTGADLRGLVAYSELQIEHVDWLIAGVVPAGMLSVLAGEQGLGKSLLHAQWASQLSQSEVASILISAEDSPTHTTKARLLAAQAKQEYVYHAAILPVLGNGKDPEWLGRLSEWISRTEAELLVFDPISAFIDSNTDSYKDQHIRRILSALSEIAGETGCSIVYIMHLTKGAGMNPLQRIAGSVAFTAAARSVLLLTPLTDPYHPARILSHVKCNVGEKAPPQRWEIEPILIRQEGQRDISTARIAYQGVAEGIDVATLLAPTEDADEQGERTSAREIILGMIAAGPTLSRDLERAVREAGVSPRTYDRARRELGVRAYQHNRQWFSHLATVTSQDANAQDATYAWRPDKPASEHEVGSHKVVQDAFPVELRPEADSVSQSTPNLGTASLSELAAWAKRETGPNPT